MKKTGSIETIKLSHFLQKSKAGGDTSSSAEPFRALRGNSIHAVLNFGVCAVIMLLIAILCVLIRPAADDFYYYTFCDGGLKGYLQNSLLHYQTVTGRVFVHLILCPLLRFQMWPFRVFNFLLIVSAGWLCACLCSDTASRRLPLFTMCLCMFFLTGLETLSDAVLWGAGSLNYLFPVFLVLLYYSVFRKQLSRKTGGYWMAVLAFLCAATVEMTGLLTVLVVIYVSATHMDLWKPRRGFILVNFCSSLLGYLSLFTSPGVKTRLEETYVDINLFQRINVNFSLFDRKMCGPEGIWVITFLSLLSASLLLFLRNKHSFAVLSFGLSLGVVLTGTGILSDGIPVAVLSLCAFFFLLGYSGWMFCTGERLIPLCMLCTTVSLSVCLVSPVIGPRMVFPSAVFLIVLTIRTLYLCCLQDQIHSLIVSVLGISTMAVLCFYIIFLAINAKVIDQNDLAARTYQGDGVLEMVYVPDERFGGNTVPTPMNFCGYYLQGIGRPDLKIQFTDPSARSVYCERGTLDEPALLRGDQYYIPIRAAVTLLGAEAYWESSSAVVIFSNATYRFHQGNYVAECAFGVGPSIKLSDPVRLIGSRIYISQRDFESLFHMELLVTDYNT